ncbi:hypothetical protein [Erythrobacter sp. THAF29]|uniref:hypothetical protein n=1 Tax=Erythrobacter sp. THAF29 TaxID=2587851 RepID=UPI0012696647|nr:hypothetical protein [Erythrobacter sp. THAF29]QFT78376.1 hypothetical protein FIU90_12570 [Erythrobacter sp. THAF29]
MKFRAHRFNALVAAFAATLVSTPLAAQEGGGQIEFTVKGETFVLDVPEGYCPPTGAGALIAAQFADADSANLTPVNIQRCGTYGEDYVLIKTPRMMPAVPLSKPVFLQIMTSEIQKQDMIQQGIETGKKDIDKVTDGKMDIDFEGIRYRKTDDQCVYLAGVAQVAVQGEESNSVAVGSCGTLVGTRHFFAHAYKKGETSEDVENRMALSRDISLRISQK